MKIAHIGDIHLGLGYPGPTPESRFEDITRIMDWSAEQIIAEGCKLVLLAGDLFKDSRVYLDRASREIITMAAWLRRLSQANINVIAISGTPSHDAISAYHIINEMQIPYLTISTAPEAIGNPFIAVACLPGMNRASLVAQEEYRNLQPHVIHQIMTQRITETCQDMLIELRRHWAAGPYILLGHLTYDLADKGFEDVLMQHEPVLTPEAIQGYDLVCLGHIHRPQQNGNVFYCGSPERLTFNDENITPGFWIHDLQDGNITSNFIATPARRYTTLDWSEDQIEGFSRNGMHCFGDSFVDHINNAIVRLRYSCTDDIAKRLDKKKVEQELYDAGAFFVTEIAGTVAESTRNREEEVTAEMGPGEALRKWCEQPDINIDPEEIPFLLDMTAGLLGGVSA